MDRRRTTANKSVAVEGRIRDGTALQVPSGVLEKEEAIALHAGTKDWTEEVCIACTRVSPAPVASLQLLAHPWSDAVVVLRRIGRA